MLSNNNTHLLASDLKSLTRNAIMQVLFPLLQATTYSSSGSMILGEQMVHINQFELALSNTEQNFFIYSSPREKK